MKVFAQNFRGFKEVELDLEKITLLVGDNSSGKSSLLHLVDSVLRNGLYFAPVLSPEMGVGSYDYFSPYFKYADVLFGYQTEVDHGSVCKIISVRKGRDKPPRIAKCTYLIGRTLISLKRRGTTIQGRVTRVDRSPNIKGVIEHHYEETGFKSWGKQPKGMTLGNPSIIMAVLDHGRWSKEFEREITDQTGNTNFIDALFGQDLPTPRLISPLRALPEPYYSPLRRIDARGLHFAPMLRDFAKSSKSGYWDAIEKFGKESKLFDRIVVKKMSTKVADSPLLVSVERNKKEFLLTQVGVGVSQVVPVLIETLATMANAPNIHLLLQQPELHLHPVAQSALGSYLFRSAKSGLRAVIETHSSFLIDRIRAEIRDENAESDGNKLDSSKFEVLFCQNLEDGNHISRVSISNSGKLVGEPDAYHSFFVGELLRTMF